jgi:hypothetical protein
MAFCHNFLHHSGAIVHLSAVFCVQKIVTFFKNALAASAQEAIALSATYLPSPNAVNELRSFSLLLERLLFLVPGHECLVIDLRYEPAND